MWIGGGGGMGGQERIRAEGRGVLWARPRCWLGRQERRCQPAAAAAGVTVARGWWYMCGKARAPLVARRVHRHAADLGAREHAAQRRHVAAQLLGAEVRPVRGLAEQRGALEVLTWIRCCWWWWWERWGWGVGMGRAPAFGGPPWTGRARPANKVVPQSEDRPRPAPACTLTRASTSGCAAARGGACCCCCCCCCSWTSSSMTRPSAAAPPAAA